MVASVQSLYYYKWLVSVIETEMQRESWRQDSNDGVMMAVRSLMPAMSIIFPPLSHFPRTVNSQASGSPLCLLYHSIIASDKDVSYAKLDLSGHHWRL